MVPKQDQQRVRSLLTDAITILCRNGLSYKSEFCIEGLLGITLDNHDIFLINIKETIRSSNFSGCSPNSKDPTLAPLDLMVFNSLNDVPTTIGEDLSMKHASLTSTPGKKQPGNICAYLDRFDGNPDMGVKGDTSFNFALNYADYDVIEDLSRAGCGKRIQNLTMDDLAVLDNDMGDIMEKEDVVTQEQPRVTDKISQMKAAGLDNVSEPMEHEQQAETLDLSMQDVITIATKQQADEGMPLNLSEPKKRKVNKKKYECSSCHKSYKSETSLNKHKCKAQQTETTQPLDLTLGRLEAGQPIITILPDHPLSTFHDATDTQPFFADTTVAKIERITMATPASDEDDDDTFVCVCGKGLPDYDSYIDHTTLCTKAKLTPYKTCDICCKSFFSNSGYVKHKRLHQGAYKLRCHVCQKGFFDSTHLNAHIDARHSKVRRYECEFCDKSFFWKHHLKRHLVTCERSRAQSRTSCSSDSHASPPDTTNTEDTDNTDKLAFEWTAI